VCGDDYLSDEKRREFWDSVAFYNYVQEYAGESPDGTVTDEMWSKAKEPFLEVLEELKPDALLVLGKKLSKNLPALDDFGVETCVVTHPSSSHFSYSDCTSDVQSMLDAA
jgi:ABC-type Fe3+-hydroxamate transport system substrate-binding protein